MVEVLTSCQGQSLALPELHLLMNASVLVVGDEQFLTLLINRVRSLVTGTVAATSRLDEVRQLIEAQQPSILILQASQAGSLKLCQSMKQETQLSWIYCILVEAKPQLGTVGELNRELMAEVEALENGADAYLQLPTKQEVGTVGEEELTLQDRLLSAQIQAGLRQVQRYQELMQSNDLLSSIALADPLTELSNRRALEWDLPRQVQSSFARSAPLSLIMLDVDRFKSVNDTYGHLVGDRVLRMLAARLQHNLRVQDTLFRYGGEEFVIVLSNTASPEALLVANRLRRLLSDQPFNIDENLALDVTVSMGTASLKPTDDAKGLSLLNRADQNLLQAKNTGRNQVVSEE